MEKSTVIGLILGAIAVVGGMLIKGASMSVFVNPEAFLIIIVGTVAALMMAFPLRELMNFPKLLKILFTEQKLIEKKELIQMFIQWITITRREGLLALESHIEEIEDQFLKTGMRMVVDGSDHEFIRDVMMEDISAMEERHRSGAQIFAQAGMYAPTLGVLGAVIGLISALGSLADIAKLGESIAAAFVATLLGIFTGYVIWHPSSNKLKQLSKKEVEIKLMMVEGLLSIQSGISASAMEQKLSVFLTPSERYAEGEEEEEEENLINENSQTAS